MQPKLFFLVAGGERARLILRHGSGEYETVDSFETDSAAFRPRRDTRVRVQASGTGRGSAVETDDGADRAEHSAFALQLAEAVNSRAGAGELDDGWVLVAPARLGGAIKRRLTLGAHRTLARQAAKDLTRLPEADLHDRLEHMSLAPVQ